jgi:hypothetical protein
LRELWAILVDCSWACKRRPVSRTISVTTGGLKLQFATDRRDLSPSTHEHIFHLDVIINAVLGTFAARAGLLDPAEWRHLVRDDALVYPDDAVVQRLGNALDIL